MSFHPAGESPNPEATTPLADGRNQAPPADPVRRTTRMENPAAERRHPAGPWRPAAAERSLVRHMKRMAGPDADSITVLLGDEEPAPLSPPAPCVVRIRDRATLWKLAWDPGYWLLEGYSAGTIEITGDLLDLLTWLKRDFSLAPERPPTLTETFQEIFRRRRGASRQTNVAHHYDLGNDFYRLWLDEQLLYTCAYFESAELSLEAAQVAKMDHVCRKLRLRPGERVIEAGCGWGALALHMARHYGVTVRAYNLSREQLAHGRERANREGLASRVEFVEADWSAIEGRCDAFVSVGMLEHVGPENFRDLGRIIDRALLPAGHESAGGRGLIHAIGQNTAEPLSRWIEERIFPGAQPPTLQQMMDLFVPYNLSVLDVENLRPHYAQTLAHWLERFERSAPSVSAMFDERFVRMWRMYLASSQAAFEVGSLQLYQVLFAPIGSSFLPRTRHDLYRADPALRSG